MISDKDKVTYAIVMIILISLALIVPVISAFAFLQAKTSVQPQVITRLK